MVAEVEMEVVITTLVVQVLVEEVSMAALVEMVAA